MTKYRNLIRSSASIIRCSETYLDRHMETGVPVTRHFYDAILQDGTRHKCHTRGAAEMLAAMHNGNAMNNTGKMKDFHYSEDYAQ